MAVYQLCKLLIAARKIFAAGKISKAKVSFSNRVFALPPAYLKVDPIVLALQDEGRAGDRQLIWLD
eukprot:5651212-Pleurochrysis_carterae.AAC.1